MQLISTMTSGPLTLRAKLPSRSVETPFDVPCSTTVAPMTGPIWSTTLPETVYSSCADKEAPAAHNSTTDTNILLILSIKVRFNFIHGLRKTILRPNLGITPTISQNSLAANALTHSA